MTRIALVIVAATLALAACGKRGDLERPPAPTGNFSGAPTQPDR